MDFFRGLSYLLSFNFVGFVDLLNQSSIIITWFIFLLFCLCVILLFLKLFGEAGMYVYTVIAIIAANIQVLKIVEFPFFSNPIALGTILFASTFLTTDILTEYYGAKFAKKNILMGFAGFLLMTLIMLFSLGVTPLESSIVGEELATRETLGLLDLWKAYWKVSKLIVKEDDKPNLSDDDKNRINDMVELRDRLLQTVLLQVEELEHYALINEKYHKGEYKKDGS